MTTASPIPAAEAAPHMADSPDTEAQAPPQPVPAAPAKTSTGRPRLRDQAAENPLLTLFGTLLTLFSTIIVVLLVFVLGTTNLRIDDTNDRIDGLEDRFASLEQRVIEMDLRLTAQIAALDLKLTAQIAELDRKLTALIAEQDRKLTALIAALNATADGGRRPRGSAPAVRRRRPRLPAWPRTTRRLSLQVPTVLRGFPYAPPEEKAACVGRYRTSLQRPG